MSIQSLSPSSALSFCRNSPSAVVVTVWPRAFSQVQKVRDWLASSEAEVLLEKEVRLKPRSGVATTMALYLGEDWIHSNCWYGESPLPGGPPPPPYAGAKWKAALTFTDDEPIQKLKVFVVDSAKTNGALWRGKYRIREDLRGEIGGLGNCCLHLTDDQSSTLDSWDPSKNAGGYSCDSSYAFHCARVLLDESSVALLDSLEYHDENEEAFRSTWDEYEKWLSDPNENIGTAPKYLL
ncbi:hypothetical protein TrVE_jg4937 [Triparma verrucosa]|uniref:Uncharacterized protein n=1 Tax=Triparma verrucosa TaxID=1606542 RepID=A0A9W7KU25_9STRA|nr:hypothetical protein TrVE_jg4937 [Triparma verrucosa]